MARLVEKGYGQLEPNHLSAQRNGQIYAQLPCAAAIEVLENAQFAKYDYAAGEVNYTGEGEWMLVYNEVKLYDPRHSYKDFALKKEDRVDGVMTPRLFKTMPGDIFTTNMVEVSLVGVAPSVGAYLTPNAQGVLAEVVVEEPEAPISATAVEMVWKVVKVYTMADGQAAVKVQRIK